VARTLRRVSTVGNSTTWSGPFAPAVGALLDMAISSFAFALSCSAPSSECDHGRTAASRRNMATSLHQWLGFGSNNTVSLKNSPILLSNSAFHADYHLPVVGWKNGGYPAPA